MSEQGAAVELTKLKEAYEKLQADYQLELDAKHEAWDAMEALQAPQAVGGSFKRVLAVVEAAATATDKRAEWDRAGCEELVVEMVKSMLSREEAKKPARVRELTTKVIPPPPPPVIFMITIIILLLLTIDQP
jgi:hypothetical protein